MKKRKYLALLLQQDIDWLCASVQNPSKYMTKIQIALHRLAIKRKFTDFLNA